MTSPLLADFIHASACKPICAKLLTLPSDMHFACWIPISEMHITAQKCRRQISRRRLTCWLSQRAAKGLVVGVAPGCAVDDRHEFHGAQSGKNYGIALWKAEVPWKRGILAHPCKQEDEEYTSAGMASEKSD